MKDYLHNKKPNMFFYDKTKSDMHHIFTGEPQGSKLGPLLFIIYSNDLCKMLIYADDTTLYPTLDVFWY